MLRADGKLEIVFLIDGSRIKNGQKAAADQLINLCRQRR